MHLLCKLVSILNSSNSSLHKVHDVASVPRNLLFLCNSTDMPLRDGFFFFENRKVALKILYCKAWQRMPPSSADTWARKFLHGNFGCQDDK